MTLHALLRKEPIQTHIYMYVYIFSLLRTYIVKHLIMRTFVSAYNVSKLYSCAVFILQISELGLQKLIENIVFSHSL